MKRTLDCLSFAWRCLLVAGLLLYCPMLTKAQMAQVADSLQSCDLLFVAPAKGNAITEVTTGFEEMPIDHVAIYYKIGEERKVVEAWPDGGVQMVSLEMFLERNKDDAVYIGRLTKPFSKRLTLRNALQYVGRPYDDVFLYDNRAIYCSELVQFSYVDNNGNRIFDAIPMSFHDSEGHITAYWLDFYKKRGMEVPEGQPGTNPGEMSRRTDVRIVCRLQ